MKKIALLLISSAVILTACDVNEYFEKPLPTKIENEDEPILYWSEATAEYGLAPQGTLQSPINIDAPIAADMEPLNINYGQVTLNLDNNGYIYEESIPLKQQKQNVLTIDNKPYYLYEWHLHVPGEHKVRGKKAPLEIHFVHRSDDNKYAVIGVMYEYGKANEAVETLFKAVANPKSPEKLTVNVRELLPEDLSYYYYSGSLTSPPYTEGFKWFVLQNPQTFTKADMKTYKQSGLKPNARAVQDIQARRVKKVTAN